MALKCVLHEMNRIEFCAWSFQVSHRSSKVLEKEQKFQACRCFEIGCSLKKSLIFVQCGSENYLASPLVAMHLLNSNIYRPGIFVIISQ